MAVTLPEILRRSFAASAEAHRAPHRVWRAARAIMACRPAGLGGHVRQCPAGHVTKVWDNSCRGAASFNQPSEVKMNTAGLWKALVWLLLFLAFSGPASVSAACPTAIGSPVPSSCPTDPADKSCQCLETVDKICHPEGKILETFIKRGGCEAFGKPLIRERPRLAFGGRYQTFEWGEIAHYPTFVNGAKTPDFMISALQPKSANPPYSRLPTISLRWGPTKPYSYDKFLVRWDREDNEKNVEKQHEGDKQQADVGSGDSGFHQIDAQAEGVYSIYIEGCDESF